MSGFQVTKIVREFINTPEQEDGKTPGQLLDALLLSSLKDGMEVQSVNYMLSEDGIEWSRMMRDFLNGEGIYAGPSKSRPHKA